MTGLKVSIISAIDEENGIGKNNKIPWHIKGDLVRLKKLTLGKVVVLGRNTYESMVWYYDRSGRPMPGKLYMVVTKNPNYKPARDKVAVVHSVKEAVQRARQVGENDVFIIGGEQIFREALVKGLVQRLYLTKVQGDYGADTFFPDYSDFKKTISEEAKEESGLKFKYITLEK